jgi:hypothetical protein
MPSTQMPISLNNSRANALSWLIDAPRVNLLLQYTLFGANFLRPTSWFRSIALRLAAAAFGGAHVALTHVALVVVVYRLVDNVFGSFGRLHLEHHIFGG